MRGNPKVRPDSSVNWMGEQPKPSLSGRVTLVFYRRRAFVNDVRTGVMLWRAFDKTVGGGRWWLRRMR